MNSATLKGVLCSSVEQQHTTTGKTCLRFSVTSGSKVCLCVAWMHMLNKDSNPNRLMDSNLGEQVSLTGFWGDGQKKKQSALFKEKEKPDDSEKEFVVKGFWFDGDKAQVKQVSKKERLKELVSEKSFREYHEEKRRQGKVRVRVRDDIWVYANESECVQHDGRWKRKIQYCMDVLGADRVTKELMGMGLGSVVTGKGKKAVDGSWVPAYLKKLEELVAEANGCADTDVWGDSGEIF